MFSQNECKLVMLSPMICSLNIHRDERNYMAYGLGYKRKMAKVFGISPFGRMYRGTGRSLYSVCVGVGSLVLTRFGLYSQLGGRIPEEIGNSKLLTLIALDGNLLTGPIPASLGNLSSLSIPRAAVNQLTGQIPANIGTLNNLTDVRLFANKLTGLVPEELGNLSSLTVLHLAENNFYGHLPQEVCRGGTIYLAENNYFCIIHNH
ncbi:hypothetical protein LWI29_020686 [Acer saccharum]|uniref:Uncharacterized protein n=1 Tax=Acer saccharum TaxID=4024 RepID=A0AA39VXS7_ACESA|nr:hypothetical protein LWI29_020686 [Acer saccharum]